MPLVVSWELREKERTVQVSLQHCARYLILIRSEYLMSLIAAITDASCSIRPLSCVAPILSVSSHSLSDAFKSPISIDVVCWFSSLDLSFSLII